MSVNLTTPSCTSPQIVTTTDLNGVRQARCFTCGDRSPASKHAPRVDEWARDHRRRL